MPEVSIKVGGRSFKVACNEGDEHLVLAAAEMLDAEAASSGTGQLQDSRMLLMAGLMLADKTAGMRRQLADMRKRAESAEEKLAQLPKAAAPGPDGAEASAMPRDVIDSLVAIAERAEELAASVEKRAAG